MRSIITDVEGTTSSLSFVKDVLFPFAAARLPEYVRQHADQPEVRRHLDETAALAGLASGDLDGVVRQLLAWIAEDRKATPLKALQGMIWESGYRNGDYRAHLYEDAAVCLRQWYAEGCRLFVYSSGSVQAQELFFQYSAFGDLRELFAGHFDTRIGAKGDPEAYAMICRQASLTPAQTLFLSDVEAELDAAATAGLATARLCRKDDYGMEPDEVVSAHPVYASFRDLPEDLLK